jgi:CRP-like cAMP-binding protein
MEFCTIEAKKSIFLQGDYGSEFFIVESGIFLVLIDGKVKRELKREDGFGELALLYNAPRSSTIEACEDSTLWMISRQSFRHAVETIVLQNYEQNRKFMEVSDFYRNSLKRLYD